MSDEVFTTYLATTYQVQSRKLIPAAHYQTVRAWLIQRDHRRTDGDHVGMSVQPHAPAVSPSSA